MYRRPENLDKRIDDALFEKLMDIASEESDAAYSFGSPSGGESSGAFGAAQIAANVAEWDKWDIEYHEENRRHAAKIRELMERMRSVVRGEPVPRK